MSRYLEPLEPTSSDWLDSNKATVCNDWDAQDMHPRLLIDRITGNCYGQLMPVDRELVARTAGIQDWSRV